MTTNAIKQVAAGAGVARLSVVGQAMTAMNAILNASPQMPRMAVLSGPPGHGKSQAAMFLAHPQTVNAVYVALRMFDTTKTMAQLIATEADVRWKEGWSTAKMFDAICERLSMINRPLVIDEVDHIAEKSSVDFIRAIHDQVSCPIFMIGEERLQAKLLGKHERFHDRVLTWQTAVPCDADDAMKLAKHYAPQLAWDADVCAALAASTGGVARRITTEVARISEQCKRNGVTAVTVAMVSAGGRGR